MRGLEGLYVGSSWTTFYTGLSPAGHGFYRPSQIVPGEYANFRPLDVPDGFAGTPVWTLASEAGRRVCVVDAPLCPLEQNMNGVHVVEWSGEGHVAFSTTPPELATEILERYGEHPRSTTTRRFRPRRPRAHAEAVRARSRENCS